MDMKITFPGNRKVDAHYQNFTIHTDQKISEGGDGTAPEPFTLFLSSIGTCTGIYILRFCQERDIPTKDISLQLNFSKNPTTHLIEQIQISIQVPPNFPNNYQKALIKVAELCTVKRHLDHPPKIDITVSSP
ncbi:MAG: OsmC family protein [Candidatus Thermoplasmatota archaeon]|nr:OsmC family protein [Candidatus Thermoplasmatota archaeon]MBU1941301.1 OsmC family protein [Candidatus Thermoplasmatota archaeon]